MTKPACEAQSNFNDLVDRKIALEYYQLEFTDPGSGMRCRISSSFIRVLFEASTLQVSRDKLLEIISDVIRFKKDPQTLSRNLIDRLCHTMVMTRISSELLFSQIASVEQFVRQTLILWVRVQITFLVDGPTRPDSMKRQYHIFKRPVFKN